MHFSNINKAANVYIMKKIYDIVKSKKVIHNKFIVINGKEEGGKSRYKRWDSALGLNLGKNRTKRILDSAVTSGKSGLTSDEIKILKAKTNIEEYYFTLETNVLIPIVNVDFNTWVDYFNNIKDKKKQYHINEMLELAVDNFLQGEMDDSEIVYRLIYYYVNGKAYSNERRQDIIMKKIKAVAEVKPSEWIQCSEENIDCAIADLESTLSFLRAFKYYQKALNKEKVKIDK